LKDFIEVEAFPQDLPHDVTIDISVIKNINDVIVVGDLKFSDKVEVLDDPEQAIVTVLIMTEETEEVAVAAVEATPAAGAAPAAAPAKDDKKEQKK
jgi:large subunit ribosomal protein L25